MTGSLQIKGNKYYVVLNVKNEFGKPKKKCVSTGISTKGNNKRAAKEKLNQIISDYAYLVISFYWGIHILKTTMCLPIKMETSLILKVYRLSLDNY